MAVIIVPASGLDVTNPTLNDTLQADPAVDTSTFPVVYSTEGQAVLKSVFIGSGVEVDINGSSTGTGSVTGSAGSATALAGTFVNYATLANTLDVNGTIATAFDNEGPLLVSAGERLAIEGNFISLNTGSVTVAAGGELDANSLTTASIQRIDVEGTLVATAPLTTLGSGSTLDGALVVRGDALNGFGNGVAAARSVPAYVATLDLRQAPSIAALPSLTLGQDAAVQFGANAYSVKRLLVNGAGSTASPLDSVQVVGGTLTVTGDKSGAVGQAVLAGALLTSGNQSAGAVSGTIDLAVSAADHGASLQQVVTVDANTTLRNDGALTIGGQVSGSATIGSAMGAAGSTFINAGTITVAGGATLNVASIQNSGTIDITVGTLAIGAGLTGSGVIRVENGATLLLSSPASFGGTLQLAGSTSHLDLAGVSASSGTVTGGKLVVTTSTGTISFAETGLANGTNFSFTADSAGGSVGAIAAAGTPSGTSTPVSDPVFRFFSKTDGTHFYTGSASEAAALQTSRSDLTYEGVGLKSADPATDSSAAAVYRFFETKNGTHFYTASAAEKNSLLTSRPDLSFEGVGFYEHTSRQAGDVAVLRYFDTHVGTQFFSSSASEQATIAASRPDLINEGVAFYAPST